MSAHIMIKIEVPWYVFAYIKSIAIFVSTARFIGLNVMPDEKKLAKQIASMCKIKVINGSNNPIN